jgi:hypothetical protein
VSAGPPDQFASLASEDARRAHRVAGVGHVLAARPPPPRPRRSSDRRSAGSMPASRAAPCGVGPRRAARPRSGGCAGGSRRHRSAYGREQARGKRRRGRRGMVAAMRRRTELSNGHAVVARDRGEGPRLLSRGEALLQVLVGALDQPTSLTAIRGGRRRDSQPPPRNGSRCRPTGSPGRYSVMQTSAGMVRQDRRA